jgi:hypothetical protein
MSIRSLGGSCLGTDSDDKLSFICRSTAMLDSPVGLSIETLSTNEEIFRNNDDSSSLSCCRVVANNARSTARASSGFASEITISFGWVEGRVEPLHRQKCHQ